MEAHCAQLDLQAELLQDVEEVEHETIAGQFAGIHLRGGEEGRGSVSISKARQKGTHMHASLLGVESYDLLDEVQGSLAALRATQDAMDRLE